MLEGRFISVFSSQGCDISALPADNNPREDFQTGRSEENAGESHQEDGKVTNPKCLIQVAQLDGDRLLGLAIKREHWKNDLFFRFLKTRGVIRRMDLTLILPMSQAGVTVHAV